MADYVTQIKDLIEKRASAFEEFKSTNDERLSKLASHEAVSSLEEKQARIEKTLDAYEKEIAELKRIGTAPAAKEEEEAGLRKSFESVLRTGSSARLTEDALDALAKKQADLSHGEHTAAEYKNAMIAGSEVSGGLFVLPHLDRTITKLVTDEVAIMGLANNVTISTAEYRKRIRVKGTTCTWEGEQTHPATTDTPEYAMVNIPVRTITANPSISAELLADADVNVEGELMEALALDFADAIGDALVNGNDNRRPSGILSAPTVANASWSWGNIGYVKTGAASDFASSAPGDCLVDLIYGLDRRYAPNARFLMNRATLAAVRKFKDGDGNYLWAPAFTAGEPDTILGFPVSIDAKMPAVGANAFPIAFGDFRQGYTVVKRAGINVLRDPYTSKPFVIFSTRMRIGGGITNYEAFKLLKVSA